MGIVACVSPRPTSPLSVLHNLSTHPPVPVDRVVVSSRVLWFGDVSSWDSLAASGRGYVLAQVVLVGHSEYLVCMSVQRCFSASEVGVVPLVSMWGLAFHLSSRQLAIRSLVSRGKVGE